MAPDSLRLAAPLPAANRRLHWCCAPGSMTALAVALTARAHAGLVVLLTADPGEAMNVEQELGFFLRERELPVAHFPDRETLPYDNFSPVQDITSERLAALHALPQLRRGVLVLPVRTALHRLPPTSYVRGRVLHLRQGDRFDPIAQRRLLEQAGYRHAETVLAPGEFALRGAVMDVFPMGSPRPFRIDLLDDEIDTLRSFDTETQRSLERFKEVRLLPGREMPIDEAAIALFRRNWHETFSVDVRRCPVYQDVSQGVAPAGVEYYLPFFFAALHTIFDYLPEDALVVVASGATAAAHAFDTDARDRYEDHRHDLERPLLPPASLFLTSDEFFAGLHAYPRVNLTLASTDPAPFAAAGVDQLEMNARARDPAERLHTLLRGTRGAVLFTADSAGRREVLTDLLTRSGIGTEPVADWNEFLTRIVTTPALRAITVAPLTSAFSLTEPSILVIPEAALLGHKAVAERRRYRAVDPELVLRNLTELTLGAPVVHLEHGVGRYHGLQMLDVDDQRLEFLVLEYADAARLYVPVASLHLVSRYAGSDEDHAPLHRLGSDQWEKARRRAAENARDVAAELLDIYARRAARPGIAYPAPDAEYERFAAQFAFDETPDQADAITAVIEDMKSAKPMDRLICGDVGFGKTEVAMRAAFIAAQHGRQVVILVPTTLLAQQHLDTFSDRFADWGVRVELISRQRSDKEVGAIKERIARGQVDVVIGTHKVLGRDFSFANLGLVIIDEEHRFGVRHKEQLKALRAEVDVLALTATPIPRTLNMAVAGIRDMSIIATPPARRLAIKTFVRESSRMLIHEAIVRELARGGQVFYLHNEVRNIAATAQQLAETISEARVAVGHGQMRPRELEQVMSDFSHRRTNVLVCTTIIETGLDIPNANTIIVDRADKFGLAQLHQLRGRVGRSHRQAYAYLLTPPPKAMTSDAVKRLEAIEAAGDLGIGFTLATHDLEIRGAGELLGDEQSGQIEGVGFSLYMDLLQRAVEAIRAGRTPNLDEPLDAGVEVNLRVPALIPDDFLPEVHSRLMLYKRIASAANDVELDNLRAEMHDRFGILPAQTLFLFRVTAIKLAATRLGLKRIDFGPTGGTIDFLTTTPVHPMTLIRLAQERPKELKLDSAGNRLRVSRACADVETRFATVHELLGELTANEPLRPRATGRR